MLIFENIFVQYPGNSIPTIFNCNLKINKGEKVALLGVNGSGKSTLLKICAGLIDFSGKAYVNGLEVNKNNIKQIRSDLGYVFTSPEDQILFPRVFDDVAFSLKDHFSELKVKTILSKLGLSNLGNENPYNLSHGQKMRVALAGALVHSPKLLIFDEPSALLDPPGKQKLSDILLNINTTILTASHDLSFVKSFCSHYVLLQKGNPLIKSSDIKNLSDKIFFNDQF